MPEEGLRILLVEDNPGDARLVGEAVKQATVRLELTHARTLEQAFEHLRADRYDAVLLDLGLPDSQGLETVVRTRKEYPGATIVVLTGLDDGVTAMKAVQNGAQDYLVKGQIGGELLVRAIRYAVERTRYERADSLRRRQNRLVWRSLHGVMGSGSSSILYRAGTDAGLSVFDFIHENWRPRNEDEFLDALREHLMSASICTMGEFTLKKESFEATAQVRDSFELDAYDGKSEAGVCHFLRGLVCGLATRLVNAEDLVCDETSCQRKGDAVCTFRVHRMFQ